MLLVVYTSDSADPLSRNIRREVEHVVRLTQGDEHLAPVRQPPRLSRLPKALVRDLDAAEVGLQRLVLRRDLDWIGRFVERAPDGGTLVGGRLTQLVHPFLAFEVAQQADHLI